MAEEERMERTTNPNLCLHHEGSPEGKGKELWVYYCTLKDKKCPDPNHFPPWCPLELAPRPEKEIRADYERMLAEHKIWEDGEGPQLSIIGVVREQLLRQREKDFPYLSEEEEMTTIANVEVHGKVVNVDFYTAENLPQELVEDAKRHKFKVEKGIIAVKTLMGETPTYEYEFVGSSPEDIRKFMANLAEEDGVKLNDAVRRAFGGVR